MVRQFLRKLTGRGGDDGPAERETYEGYEILAWPRREGSLWRVAGRIQRVGEDAGPGYDFVRADTVGQHDEAVNLSLVKGRQLVDEQGERLLRKD